MRRIRKKNSRTNKIISTNVQGNCHEFVEKWVRDFQGNPTNSTLPSGIGLTFRHSYKDI